MGVQKRDWEEKQINKINTEYPLTTVLYRWYNTAVQIQHIVVVYLYSKYIFQFHFVVQKYPSRYIEIRKNGWRDWYNTFHGFLF